MQQGPRVAVIGLDCGTPQLLFRDLVDEIPNIRKLMDDGMHGDLASITPPITVPAWACAMTGKTPGQLGHLRLPQPQGPHVRRPVDRALRLDQGARRLGQARRAGQALAADRRAARLPAAEGVPGLARRLLPDAAVSAKRFAFPQELEVEIDEELGGPGQLHLRHPELPRAGHGSSCWTRCSR